MRISVNVIWNTAGIVVPLVVGVVVAPMTVAGLGVERFGILSLVWTVIGYFSVFDFGLGRTLTKLVADRIGTERQCEIPGLVGTTAFIVVASGVVLGAVVGLLSRWFALHLLHVTGAGLDDAARAIAWLAVSLPFVLLATALYGLLEAYQEFGKLSLVRMAVGVLMFLTPLVAMPFSRSLALITALLACVRVVTAYALWRLVYRVVPEVKGRLFALRRAHLRPLLIYGGWLTVSNIVGPVMVYFDRFLIAATLGTATIAYYTVPYDVLTRLWVFPTAIQAVMFPAFAALRQSGSSRLVQLFARSSFVTLLIMLPALVGVELLGLEALGLWMGRPFATHSADVARILMLGVFTNAMARTPFVYVQSAGFASWSAAVHLVELPFYALLLWWLLHTQGLTGAAYAWTARMSLDMVVFFVLAARIDRPLVRAAARDVLCVTLISAGAAAAGMMLGGLVARILALTIVVLGCGALLAWQLKSLAVRARRAAIAA